MASSICNYQVSIWTCGHSSQKLQKCFAARSRPFSQACSNITKSACPEKLHTVCDSCLAKQQGLWALGTDGDRLPERPTSQAAKAKPKRHDSDEDSRFQTVDLRSEDEKGVVNSRKVHKTPEDPNCGNPELVAEVKKDKDCCVQ